MSSVERLYDGRPVSETLDTAGSALPGCDPTAHREDGKHSLSCIVGAWGFHRDGAVWRRNPTELGDTPGDVIEYEGTVTIREVERGVILDDLDGGTYLERLPAGKYRGSIRLERRP